MFGIQLPFDYQNMAGADPEILKGGTPYRFVFQSGGHHSDSGV